MDGEEQFSGPADSNDNEIKSYRDLEDFTRLHLYIGGLQDAVADGTFQVGLEWRNTNGTNPAINVYRAGEPNGGDRYLRNTNNEYYAALQTATPFNASLGTVDGNGGFKFPSDFWQSTGSGIPKFGEDHPTRYIIFEGVTEGKGQLVLTFWKGTEKIGDGPGVWLELKNVLKMYERSYGKPRQGSVSWKKPNEYNPYQQPVVSNAPLDQIAFEQPPDETTDTIVFVHGIHGKSIFTEEQAITQYTRTASTVFKRLWWQGFKGRFGFYKWEAHHLLQFNESEYRAWKSGRGLAAFVEQLPGEAKHVWAYSQGGIVGSSAVRDYGAMPNTLIVMQAAVPAGCYDDSSLLNFWSSLPDPSVISPDTVADLGYRGYHGPTNVRIINFADPSDFATGTSWRAAQIIKPEPSYNYDSSALVGARHTVTYAISAGRFVTDLHESLSMIAESRSDSIAYIPFAGGVIDANLNLKTQFGFTNEHGAAFNRPIQRNLNDFYDEVLIRCQIPFNP